MLAGMGRTADDALCRQFLVLLASEGAAPSVGNGCKSMSCSNFTTESRAAMMSWPTAANPQHEAQE